MIATRLAQIEEVYHAVLEVAFEKRTSFLVSACGNDDELRREVESLLWFSDLPSSVIDTPPMDVAAEIFAQKKHLEIVGTNIGNYEIKMLLGKGGMGEVFLAQDTKLDRKVALKILPSEFAKDEERMSRFIREAKSASALNQPNIITIYDIGEIKGTHFIA